MNLLDSIDLNGPAPGGSGGARAPGGNSDMMGLVDSAAQRHGIPPAIARALVGVESGGRADAVSPKGARGITQVMPGTMREMGYDPATAKPEDYVDAGLGYLRKQYDEFGRWDLALSAYHAGPGAVRKAGGIPDTNDGLMATRDYQAAILGKAGVGADEPAGAARGGGRALLDSIDLGGPGGDPVAGFGDRFKQAMAEVRKENTTGRWNNLVNGLGNSFRQMPQLAYGITSLGAATLESAVGQGGVATALKQWALGGFEEWGKKVEEHTGENASLNNALEKSQKDGDIGALFDWASYGLGYAVGQIGVSLGTMGVGGLVGQGAFKGLAQSALTGMVEKEAARIAGSELAKKMTAQQIQQAAVREVAKGLGQTAALGGMAFGMEGGEIGGGLVQANRDRALTGEELARAWGMTTLAAGMEYLGDRLGLNALAGKYAPPTASRLTRALVNGAVGAASESITEGLQTPMEQIGQGKDPTTPESLRETGDAMAQAALFGVPSALTSAIPKTQPPPEKVLAETNDVGEMTKAAQQLALGYDAPPTIRPTNWEVVDPNAPAGLLGGPGEQGGGGPALPAPGPTNPEIMVDSRGNATVVPPGVQAERDQQRRDLAGADIEAQTAREVSGFTPDVERAQEQRTSSEWDLDNDIVGPGGWPFSSLEAARAKALEVGGTAVALRDGNWVVRKGEGYTPDAPRGLIAGNRAGAPADQAEAQMQLDAALGDLGQLFGKEPQSAAPKAPANRFMAFLKKWGLPMDARLGITGEEGRNAQKGVPVGLFRHNGTPLDMLVEHARAEGYLTQADVDSATDNGGVNKLVDMIERAIKGERIETVADAEQGYQAQAGARNDAELAAWEAAGGAEGEAQRAALEEAEARRRAAELTDELRALMGEDEVDDLLERLALYYEEASPQEYAGLLERAVGAARDYQAQQQAPPREPEQPAQPQGPDAGAGAAGRAQGAADAPRGQEGGGEGFLTAPTPDEIRRREALRAEAEKRDAQRDAAPPADDFRLAGSNSDVDQAEAAGQNNLFDQPAAPNTSPEAGRAGTAQAEAPSPAPEKGAAAPIPEQTKLQAPPKAEKPARAAAPPKKTKAAGVPPTATASPMPAWAKDVPGIGNVTAQMGKDDIDVDHIGEFKAGVQVKVKDKRTIGTIRRVFVVRDKKRGAWPRAWVFHPATEKDDAYEQPTDLADLTLQGEGSQQAATPAPEAPAVQDKEAFDQLFEKKPKKAAKPTPPPKMSAEERAARDQLKAALGDLGDLLQAKTPGGKANITPEQQQKLLPIMSRLFDAAIKLGKIKFQQAAKFVLDVIREKLGADVADQLTVDDLQAAYISAGALHKDKALTPKRDVVAVETKDEIDAYNEGDQQEADGVPGGGEVLAGDRGGRRAPDEDVGAPDADGVAGTGRGAAGRGNAAGGAGRAGSNDPGLPGPGTTTGRESRRDEVRGGDQLPLPADLPAGVDQSERVDDARPDGVPAGRSGSGGAGGAGGAPGPLKDAPKVRGELAVKLGDLANIRDQLPLLLAGQQEDVAFAEARFGKPDGHGVLFTNGTGTGKTFTGLGVVTRFALQGKDSILIVAPSDKILNDWVSSGQRFGLSISKLENTKDAGQGIVATTYANMGDNDALVKRKWDLIVTDEAHKLMENADGERTKALDKLQAITGHPSGKMLFAQARYPNEYRAMLEASQSAAAARRSLDTMEQVLRAAEEAEERTGKAWEAAKAKADAEFDKRGRGKALFLSATPFAYVPTVRWADGYLFDMNEGFDGRTGYNSGSAESQFFMRHFGYRMRMGKLTKPGPEVDQSLMERNFNSWLKKQGVLSGRMLDVPHDYDRRFQSVESGVGTDIDKALEWLNGDEPGRRYLRDMVTEKFDHLTRRYLLEAIKAEESVPIVRAQLKAGRKVVVFHDYKKGGGFHPFQLGIDEKSMADVHGVGKVPLLPVYESFKAAFPELMAYPFSTMLSPIQRYQREFPDLLLFNGDVPSKERQKAVEAFQDDKSGRNVILVQSAAGREGVSLHDITAGFQRVLYHLGLPTAPTAAIQQEGRIYRVGLQSDAMFRYFNTGTSWERWAFASTIARRASTAENLAMGEEARGLLDAFIQAFENTGDYPPGHDGEGKGGKAADRALAGAMSEFERAKAYYFGQRKRTSKDKSQEGVDYFATPEPLGLKMVEWAGQGANARFLEPSAGHGAIARWFPTNAPRTAVEPSSELSSRLALAFDGRIVRGSFEDFELVNKYDAIVMNPPFGQGGALAAKHLEKAWRHLADYGRIVAIFPRGTAADRALDRAMAAMDEDKTSVRHLVTRMHLPTVTFERAGTGVLTSVVIIEKRPAKDNAGSAPPQINMDVPADTIAEFFDSIEQREFPKVQRPLEAEPAPAARPASAKPQQEAGAGIKIESWDGKHSKTGEPVYYASATTRLDTEDYQRVAGIAKRHGGYWSRFQDKAKGIRPGFIFKTQLDRQAFRDAVENPPAAFRRGDKPWRGQMSVEGVQKVVDAITGLWRGAPRVRVVKGMADLPAAVQRQYVQAKDDGTIPGGVWYDGAVWLVADGLDGGQDVVKTLFHEALGHYGLRAAFGGDISRILDEIANLRRADVVAKARDYGLDPNDPEQLRQAAEEVLAEMAETRPELGFVRRAIAAIRSFLRDLGLDLALTDDEIVRDYLLPARRAVQRGGRAAPAIREARFSRGPEPFYSALERGVAGMGTKMAPAAGWKQAIKGLVNKGIVKPDEVKWSGVEEWLDAQTQNKDPFLAELATSGAMLSPAQKRKIAENPGVVGNGSKISRDDLLRYLADRGVRVQEVVRGAADNPRLTDLPDGWTVERDGEDGGWQVIDDEGDERGWGFTEAEAIANAQDDDERSDQTDTKYSSYTLPGGQNYRELLLTLPRQKISVQEQAELDAINAIDRRLTEAEAERRAQIERRASDLALSYRSSHWDEPNILAHIRFNERMAPRPGVDLNEIGERIREAVGAKSQSSIGNGAPGMAVRKGVVTEQEARWYAHHRGFLNVPSENPMQRVLFIEEIQSDWAQQGKKNGWRGEGPTEEQLAQANKAYADAENEFRRLRAEMDAARGAAAQERARQQWIAADTRRLDAEIVLRRLQREASAAKNTAPKAPFVTKTEAWVGLAVKRMIVWAAQSGMDRVAFVTGQQSADRYQLDRHISRILHGANPSDGTFNVRAYLPNGDGIALDEQRISRERLAELFGEEIAQRIERREGNDGVHILREGRGDMDRELAGVNLRVGGEGMKAFYDTIVPGVVRDVLKKLGGGKLQAVTLPKMPGGKTVLFNGVEIKTIGDIQQPGFDITPELRERVAGGVAMFSRGKVRVDGVDRPRENADGIPLGSTDDAIRNFWRWYTGAARAPAGRDDQRVAGAVGAGRRAPVDGGRSGPVDPEGRPVRLYHGTRDDIAAFQVGHARAKDFGWLGRGVYLVSDPDGANLYAGLKKGPGGQNVLPLYAAVTNPYRATLADKKRIARGGPQASRDFTAELKAAGHDGVVLEFPDGVQEWVAFEPSQVKSATGNRGTFDPGNPDIRFSRGKAPVTAEFRKWFEGSKVVDKDGQPKVVYHGTKKAGFGRFDEDRQNTASGTGAAGFFFADNELGASTYSNSRAAAKVSADPEFDSRYDGEPGNYAVYLSMKDPLTVDFQGQGWDEAPDDSGFGGQTINDIVEYAQDAGFDGVIARNISDEGPHGQGYNWSETTYVVFKPEQIKSVDNERPTDDPRIMFRRGKTSLGDLDPDQEAAARNVGAIVDEVPLKERLAALGERWKTRLAQGMVDQFAAIKDLDPKAYMQARLSKGADGTLEAMLLYGKPFMRDGVPDVNVNDGGFAKVLAALEGEHDRFALWVAAQRARDIKARGRAAEARVGQLQAEIAALRSGARGALAQNDAQSMVAYQQMLAEAKDELKKARKAAEVQERLFGDADIAALLRLNQGREAKFDQALRDLNAFNDAVLKLAAESGLVDQEAVDLFRDQPYVPFYRVMDEDGGVRGPGFGGGLTSQYAYKRMKGGSNKLNEDLLDNMLLNWAHLFSAAARNRAALASMDAAVGVGVAELVPAGTTGAVKVRRDGKEEHYTVADPYLLEAIGAIEYTSPRWYKPFTVLKKALTIGVTANPTFKIRNLIRDSVQALALADMGSNPFANVRQGFEAFGAESQTRASMLAGGGAVRFGMGVEENRSGHVRRLVSLERLGLQQNLDEAGWRKLVRMGGSLMEKYSELGDRLENVNRATLYERLRADGHDHATASFMARDLMDFSMSGRWPVVRFLSQTVPFLNARMQGLYKLGRAGAEDPARLGYVTGAVVLASLALYGLGADDDEYKKLSNAQRDTYWWFRIGGYLFSIPKPFEIGAVGSVAERTAELMFDKDMTLRRYGQRLADIASQQLAMNPVPQLARPLLDVWANKDAFGGAPIESEALRKLRAEDRATERTSAVSRVLGQLGMPNPVQLAMGRYDPLSPVQLDYLARGYFGWLGTSALTSASLAVRPFEDRGAVPAMRLDDAFLAGNFVKTLPARESKYVQLMYEDARRIEEAHASLTDATKRGDRERVAEIRADFRQELADYPRMERIKREVAEINRKIRQVESSRSLSGETKRAMLDRLAIQRDRAARGAAVLTADE